jgi:HD-GYP domain-containing protein (c-di-GMP phosphodiesterase class II)
MHAEPVTSRSSINYYVSCVALGGVVALMLAGWEGGSGWNSSPTFVNGLVAILAVGLAAELSSVSVQVGTATVSIAFIPFLAGAFLFPPFYAMLIGGLTLLTVEAGVRKKPWIKVAFNTSKELLAVGLAASVYHALGGRPAVSEANFHLSIAGVVGAGIAYSAANSLGVSLAVALTGGPSLRDAWLRIYGGSVVYDLFATPVPAALAFLYVKWQLPGVVIVSVPLFVVRHIYVQNLKLEQSNRELLDLMVKQIELVEPYTSGHSRRVSHYARVLAREAGVHGKQIEHITTAALLHDVGKVYEEYAPLLRKEGKLTTDEKKLLESHPVRSAELVCTISTLRGPVEKAIRHHHENYDGTGYPDGLSGEDIPIGARIIMVADTLDAMTTDRPYRKALPFERVIDEVRQHSGRQFDPRLVEIVTRSAAIRGLVAQASDSVRHTVTSALGRAASLRSERAAV